MGAIRLVSAVVLPRNAGVITKTPPIPSWAISGKSVPVSRRWTGAWGYATQMAGVGRVRREVQKKGLAMYTATVLIPIDRAITGSVSPQHVPDLECLPLDQMSVSLKQEIIRILESQPKSKTTSPLPKRTVFRRSPKDATVQSRLAHDPELVNKIFRHPDFRHIRIITWQSPSGEGFGVVRDQNCVQDVFVRGLPPPYQLEGWKRLWTTPEEQEANDG